ncbi:hypothetical protein DAI43_23180, partial [Achromobacter xylosoxidans]
MRSRAWPSCTSAGVAPRRDSADRRTLHAALYPRPHAGPGDLAGLRDRRRRPAARASSLAT